MNVHKTLDKIYAAISQAQSSEVQEDATRQWVTLVGRLARWKKQAEELLADLELNNTLEAAERKLS